MTRKEMFTKIATLVADEEVKAFCTAEIEKIEKSNASKKSKTSEERAKINEPIKASIVQFLADKDFTLASDIAKGCEVSTQKVTALLKQIEGVEVMDVKVPKVGTRKAYRLAR